MLCAPEMFVTTVTKGFEEVAERFMALQLPPLVLTQEQVYSDRDTKTQTWQNRRQGAGPFGEAVS